MSSKILYERLGGQAAISRIVDGLYARMLDDYRLNRFFNNRDFPEQAESLKALLTPLLAGTSQTEEEFIALLDNFFMTAFARDKRKSMVSGADWGFFGYIIEQDHPSTNYLCDSHSQLLKFMPDDSIYDAVMENLTATLQEMDLDGGLMQDVLAFAEQGRNPVLGK